MPIWRLEIAMQSLTAGSFPIYVNGGCRRTPFLSCGHCQGWKKPRFKKVLRFLKFLCKDQTRKYDPKAKAHEKHPIHGTPSPFHGLQHTKLQALL